MKPCVLVLAAGNGSRYRAAAQADIDKLLVPCAGADGSVRPMLEHALLACQGLDAQRLLITRPGKLAVEALAQRHGFDVLVLESPGLGDSLAAGVRERSQADGWLVLLGDMPRLRAATVAAVAGAMAPATIAVATGPQGFGHPVGFGRAWGGVLAGLCGDQGARRLFRADVLVPVPVSDEGIYLDVDVPISA
ncbi:NTP transferase domain-containing protein [Pseudomonas typographi]|uniref:NTP transferase domain-containing protein n=1 Tax=Pseudomonas typographi TaxID=2715964 RepID=UPI00188C074F|nr:NTP transferase domain-containing protein [Pseudomonas typographi]